MGLINDLVIEEDRRRAEVQSGAPGITRKMKPARRQPPRTASAGIVPLVLIFVGVLMLSVAAGRVVGPDVFGSFRLTDGTKNVDGTKLPVVSARRAAQEATTSLAAGSVPIETRPTPNPSRYAAPKEARGFESFDALVERPASVRTLDISSRGGETLIRIEIDGPSSYHLEPFDGSRRLDVSVSAPTNADLVKNLDLSGTPIRSMRTLSLASESILSFEFDEPEQVQSMWSEDALGSTLELSINRSRAEWTRVERDEVADAPLSEDWLHQPAMESAVGSTANDSYARAPQTGREANGLEDEGRGSFEITRSSQDRRRLGREAAAKRAMSAIEEARLARAEGEIEQAIDLYEAALDAEATNRRALFELTEILANAGRLPEAIDRVRSARHSAPNEASLTMLHAQLVERSGDRDLAIQILDRSAQTVTEAPDVHALAAAYLRDAGEFDSAIARYEAVLRRYPAQPRWWMGLGITFESAGREAEALDVYQIATQVGSLPTKSRQWVSARIESLRQEDS